MAEDKQQTLTKLYSLRAGISAVACERNKVEDINYKTDKEIRELKNEISNLNNENSTLGEKIKKNSLLHDAATKRLIASSKLRLREPSKDDLIKLKITYIIMEIILWVFVIDLLAYVFYIYFNDDGRKSTDVLGLLFLLLIIIGAAIFLQYILNACFRGRIAREKGYYNEKSYEYKTGKESNERDQQLIKKFEAENANINYKLTGNEKQISEYQNKIEQLKIAAEKDCVPHYQIGGLIQEQFENQFNSFLNLRDWEDLDVIIFAFESGRVETMKEALAYADEETRTDRIVDAINDSTQAVCRSIQSGLHSLALSMGECFSVISRQIAEQTKKLDKISVNMENLSLNTASLAKNAERYSQGLANLAARVDYSNALQEQRNKSSAELVEKNETFMLEARTYMHDLYNDRY